MLTAPQLFATALEVNSRDGVHKCFFCGASCDETHTAKVWVKDTFTALDTVASPGSQFVCTGCTECMNETGDVTLACGEQRNGQKRRMYSWVVTSTKAVAATKSHRNWLRNVCTSPPEPPFAIVISDSGQKQLLYRGVVNHSRERITVTLETERVLYWPGDLVKGIALCVKLIAVTGKPALQEGLSFSQKMMLTERLGEDVLEQWEKFDGSGLSRLAVWLSPGKEEAQNECSPAGSTGT